MTQTQEQEKITNKVVCPIPQYLICYGDHPVRYHETSSEGESFGVNNHNVGTPTGCVK
jgi:hypothetical protein